jgi:hypothetical protein
MLVATVVAGLLALTAFPFLPGRYDGLSAPLSSLALVVGVGSLLLVPVGFLWLGYELILKPSGPRRARARFAGVALGMLTFVMLIAFVAASGLFAMSLGVAVLGGWAFALWRGSGRALAGAREGDGSYARPALAMIVVPIVVGGAQLGMAGPLQEWSRDRVMDEMQHLIDDIEAYGVAHGEYPRALFSEWMDYRPEIVGVRGYQYEPVGDSYSIAVEIPTFSPSSRDYLMYNPHDAFKMASHDMWPLTWPADRLALHRGYALAREVGRPHWRLLIFD